MTLTFTDISKSYGDVLALESFSLQVGRGEIFGLIGPDGAGKTSALRIACGLLTPDTGSVAYQFRAPDRAPFTLDPASHPRQTRRHIGYMPQRFSLYPDLSVAENLRFFADLYHVSAAERRARQTRLMQFSRLGEFHKRRAGRLSGGMKQKLALMCTLIHTPQALILDEPTTGVDPVSRREFWAMLKELASDGVAILLSTPYMDEAGLCDRVALVHRGRVIAQGTPDEVTRLFPHRLMELRGEGLPELRRELLNLRIEGMQVHRFGDSLHLVYQQHEQLTQARRVVEARGAAMQPLQPGIEDTFVALME